MTVLGRQVGVAYNAGPDVLTGVAQASDIPYVLTGRVRQANGHIRVNVRLLETRSGHQLWGERFEGDARDVFQVTGQHRREHRRGDRGAVLEGEQARTWRRTTSNRDATRLFLNAWHSWLPICGGPAARPEARTIAFGPTTVRVPDSLSLAGITVGTIVAVVFEVCSGRLIAVDIRHPVA